MLIHKNCVHSRRVQSAVLLFGSVLLVPNGWATAANVADVATGKSSAHPLSIAKEVMLANDYLFGRGVAQDPKMSAFWLEKAADAGDPEAEMEMGYFYETGIGVPKDLEKAAHWYRLAGHGGLPEAKLNLGILYFWGTGVPQDREMAAQLFREAAEKGVGMAACKLGAMYASGIGIPLDKEAAEYWYEKGAKLHNPQAQYQLGLLSLEGMEKVDLRKSDRLLRASAASGYVPAMYTLGLLLSRHPELAKVPGEATQFLEQSASAGIWKSSEILGVLARDGNGVPKDDKTAYFHFRVAALQGGNEAEQKLRADLQLLASKLEPSLTTALDAEAQDWYEKHHLVLEFVFQKEEARKGYSFSAFAAPKEGEHQLQLVTALPGERGTDRGVQTANVVVK